MQNSLPGFPSLKLRLKNQLKIASFIIVGSGALLASSNASSHGHEKARSELGFTTAKVSDHVYMLSGVGGFTGGNIGLSIGEDGVAMIDNGLSSVLDLLKAEIAKTTDKPIDYLINTHVHGDHIGNNESFGSDGTNVISHRNLRTSLVEKGVSIGGGKTKPAPKHYLPVLTFSDQMTVHINGDSAQIQHFAAAHTDGDAIVLFKNANVIHTGDIMFNELFPYIDSSNGGSFKGVLAALKSIHEMANDETLIIPGHGKLATKTDVKRTIEMLEGVYQAVKALHDKGMSDDDILASKPLEPYSAYAWDFITADIMTKQVLTALK